MRYFGLYDSSNVCYTAASQQNIRKNGANPDDSMGKKLYAAVAFHTKVVPFNTGFQLFCYCSFEELMESFDSAITLW